MSSEKKSSAGRKKSASKRDPFNTTLPNDVVKGLRKLGNGSAAQAIVDLYSKRAALGDEGQRAAKVVDSIIAFNQRYGGPAQEAWQKAWGDMDALTRDGIRQAWCDVIAQELRR